MVHTVQNCVPNGENFGVQESLESETKLGLSNGHSFGELKFVNQISEPLLNISSEIGKSVGTQKFLGKQFHIQKHCYSHEWVSFGYWSDWTVVQPALKGLTITDNVQ